MPDGLYYEYLRYLQLREPLQQYHSFISVAPSPSSILVTNVATFFDYVVVHGHRYHSSRRAASSRDSLALVHTSATSTWIGEITDILVYENAHTPRGIMAAMRWFKPATALLLSGQPASALYVSIVKVMGAALCVHPSYP